MIGEPVGESFRRRRPVRRRPGVPTQERRTIPFDYAFRFSLLGEPGGTHIGKVEVSVESVFTAVSIGYGVVPEIHPVSFGIAPRELLKQVPPSTRLNAIPYDLLPLRFLIAAMAEVFDELPPAPAKPPVPSVSVELANFNAAAATFATGPIVRAPGPRTAAALRNGFRFNPEFAEVLLQADERVVPLDVLARCFQVVAPPADTVQFKYALFDDGTGREFQNEPILNIAGLGASDGGRPFRYFARPIEFSPRSVIRMQITEVGDFRGELHVSLQGFKVLGGAGTPTGRASP